MQLPMAARFPLGMKAGMNNGKLTENSNISLHRGSAPVRKEK